MLHRPRQLHSLASDMGYGIPHLQPIIGIKCADAVFPRGVNAYSCHAMRWLGCLTYLWSQGAMVLVKVVIHCTCGVTLGNSRLIEGSCPALHANGLPIRPMHRFSSIVSTFRVPWAEVLSVLNPPWRILLSSHFLLVGSPGAQGKSSRYISTKGQIPCLHVTA